MKSLCESNLNRIISFVMGIVSTNGQSKERPNCLYCGNSHVIKYDHRKGKQRFLCHDCRKTFMHSTNTLLVNSHSNQSIWADFIRDTFHGETLGAFAKKYGFSHQTAFNMRHKVLLVLQNLLENNPVLLSSVTEFDETFVLDCYKGGPVPLEADRNTRKHGAKAAKRRISNEYIAICTRIQRDDRAIATTVNRAKPFGKELKEIFCKHIAENTLALTDGLRSYHTPEMLTKCSVVNVNRQKSDEFFNLNTVNCLHSYIEETYNHYRGVATKYINRYNALFTMAFRCADNLTNTPFSSLCISSQNCYWHSIADVHNYQLVLILINTNTFFD